MHCVLQELHSVAFTGALGQPLICPEGGIGNLSADTLHEFVHANFVPGKMVLAGAGVEHKALLNLAEPMLNTAQGGSGSPEPESKYAGGDFRYSTSCTMLITCHHCCMSGCMPAFAGCTLSRNY